MNERMKRPARTMALTTLLIALYFPVQIGVIYGQSVQEKPVTNPAAANSASINEGASLFRANCSPCHGLSAKGGGRGPDLTSGRWTPRFQ